MTINLERNKLFEALSKAQAVMKGARKDSDNPYFKSSYADLSSVWEACQKPLTDNGLAVAQTVDYQDGKIFVVTILGHSSGQYLESRLPLPANITDPQKIGAAITYFRRFGLQAITGVCPIDDDGESIAQRDDNVRAVKGEYISPQQVAFLADKLRGEGETVNKLLKHFGIKKFADLPSNLWDKLLKSVELELAKEGVA